MTVKEIPLANLVENDYNPRKRFDDAAMEDLKANIEEVGLVQPPTVRPLENGTYEIIAGTRRFKALSSLYDGDHEIPVYVRDVDDDEAKWIALTENLERENLDPMEKARAYAQYVWVSPDGDRRNYWEYINEVRLHDVKMAVPSPDNESVQELAEKVPATPRQIRHRLELLVLPDEVRTMVAQDDLGIAAATEIARLRQIPDADAREEYMTSLADDYEGELTASEETDLRERVNNYLEDYKEEQEREERQLQEYKDLVDEREIKLRNALNSAVEWFNQQDEVNVEFTTNGEDIGEQAQDLIDAMQDVVNRLGGEQVDDLDDREDRLRIDRDRLAKNIDVVKSENHDRCPFCKAGVSVPDLEDRVAEYDEEIEAIKRQKRQLSDRRETFRDKRSDLRSALNRYEDARETLAKEREKVEA